MKTNTHTDNRCLSIVGPAWIAALTVMLTLMAHAAAPAATFTVNRIGDLPDADPYDGVCDTSPVLALQQCTLRAAIEQANATPGMDQIHFNILATPIGSGIPAVIQPASALPPITDPVEIDGYTQPGAALAAAGTPATLKIILDGSALVFDDGLVLEADDSRLRGLVLHSFYRTALVIDGDDNKVFGMYVGTNAAGTTALGNAVGIRVNGDGNRIGGRTEAKRNLISGNIEAGLYITGADTIVEGNFFGTDPTMTIDLGNGSTVPAGFFRGAIVVEGPDTDIGGEADGSRNVIAGNAIGIHLWRNSAGSRVLGNHIGTDLSGTDNRIGLANGTGILIDASDNQIGSENAGGRNLIANNLGAGIEIWGDNNTVLGNYVGLDVTGTAALPNRTSAIQIFGNFNQIGDTVAGTANTISGNTYSGILITYAFDPFTFEHLIPWGNTVIGNLIGLDATGTAPLGNGSHGVWLFNATLNRIGGRADGAENHIAANAGDGVRITKFGDYVAGGNLVKGNVIGLDTAGAAAGNLGSGVFIDGANANAVGGTLAGAGNTMAHNGGDGVTVAAGTQNALFGNAIFDNDLLGIDLENDGVSVNDDLDPDAGANQVQNFPLLVAAVNTGAATEITGELHSTPSMAFRVEFFSSPDCDPSGHGEGRHFVGAHTFTTDASGTATGVVTLTPAVAVGETLTATATPMDIGDGRFSTSEFSACILVQ